MVRVVVFSMRFSGLRMVDEAVDEDAGGVDLVGVELAGLDDDLGFGDGDLAAGGRVGIEVAGGAAVDEVAVGVGLPGFHEREVGEDAALEDVGVAVEVLVLFAVGDERADAGARVEAGDAGAASSHAFGERALRGELDFELAGEELAFELGILSDVAGDHFFDLTGLQEKADAPVVDARVVAGDGEVAHAGVAQSGDEGFGDAAEAEASDGQQHVVADDACEGGTGVGIELVEAVGTRGCHVHPARVRWLQTEP